MNNKNGITLIALIITIIVMLILVAVTISIAVNGGLFGYASNAARETKNAINTETSLANVEAGLSTDQLISKYTGIETFSIGENEYQYVPGMTWEVWCNSSYNADEYYCHVWQYPSGLEEDGVISKRGAVLMYENVAVLRTDLIDSEKEYFCVYF